MSMLDLLYRVALQRARKSLPSDEQETYARETANAQYTAWLTRVGNSDPDPEDKTP